MKLNPGRITNNISIFGLNYLVYAMRRFIYPGKYR